MLTIKAVKKEVDGTYQTNFSLTEEQMSFLLSYAISDLVSKGLAEIEDNSIDAVGVNLQ
jgi:hypothetical protein